MCIRKGDCYMRKLFFSLLVSFVVIVIATCSGENKDAKDSKSSTEGATGQLTIVYSGNIGGKVNPCGCRIPLGGFARRASAINDIKSKSENVLILDSGALMYPSFYLYAPYDVFSRMIAHLVAEVSVDSGLDAQNVSSYDVVNSADSLLYFAGKYPSSLWLSANIVQRGTTNLIFKPDQVFTRGNLKIGVFGFMDKSSQGIPIFNNESSLDVLDPLETVKSEAAKLRKESDIVVGLAYMDLERVQEIAKQVPEVNIFVVSHTREHNPGNDHAKFQPVMEGNTIILRCPDGGRVIGELDLSMARGSTKFVDKAGYVDLRPEAARMKDPTPTQSTFSHEFIDLGPEIPRETSIQDKINAFSAIVDSLAHKQGIDYKLQ